MPAENRESAIIVYRGINEIKELGKRLVGRTPVLQLFEGWKGKI